MVDTERRPDAPAAIAFGSFAPAPSEPTAGAGPGGGAAQVDAAGVAGAPGAAEAPRPMTSLAEQLEIQRFIAETLAAQAIDYAAANGLDPAQVFASAVAGFLREANGLPYEASILYRIGLLHGVMFGAAQPTAAARFATGLVGDPEEALTQAPFPVKYDDLSRR